MKGIRIRRGHDAKPQNFQTGRVARIIGIFITVCLLRLFAGGTAHASGPRWVAGTSYFNASAQGRPIVWANGQVLYFTDLGPLSPSVTQSQANAMIATAAAVWNGVPTAAVNIQYGGNLAEVVDNVVTVGANGVVLPADMQSTATTRPVAIVYDENGSVINDVYGDGASDPATCQVNGVFTAVDNLAVTGNIAHALIIVNGLCATSASRIATLQYELIRAFGRVLGLDWSQTNEEMFAAGAITSSGLAGWPLMHPLERLCSGEGGQCIPSPAQLRIDDIAGLNRLYPVTALNLAANPGKTLTASATLTVTGTVQFPTGQGMQGVNVVLRPVIDGVPGVQFTATAVSGEYFYGDAGNPVTGTADANGNPLTRFGSDDPSLEGYFDLTGVPLPPGVNSADYQLSFEPINSLYTGNLSVGPYTTGQAAPSGTMPVIDLGTLSAGSTASRTVIVADAADANQSGADGEQTSPAGVSGTGEWTARITGYAHTGWFQFWAQGGRQFTVEAQALDQNGASTLNKAQLVIGAWNGTDASGTAPVTGTVQPFNGSVAGLTTLPVLTSAASEVRIGVADWRGDGRPDYAWRGRILYADSVTPIRVSPAGGQIVIRGMGFRPNSTVTVNGFPAQVTSVTPNTIVAVAPPSGGVTGNVVLEVQDPQTLGVAAITSGFSYDAQSDDVLSLLTAPSGTVPIGVPASFVVRVLNADTQTPAAGVTVTFALTGGAAQLGCGQPACSVTTAGDGTASMTVTATCAATAQVTASLVNSSSVITEFSGTAPPAIVALTPNLYLVLGATVQWPIEALAISASGSPVAGQPIAWSSSSTGIALSAGQSATANAGTASVQVTAGPFQASIAATINACTGSSACAAFTVIPVDPVTANLVPWSGTSQYISAGQTFSHAVLHVTDAFGNPLAGASVTVAQALYGWAEPCPGGGRCPAAPLLGQQMVKSTSALDGSVTVTPLSTSAQPGRLLVLAATGQATLTFELDAHP